MTFQFEQDIKRFGFCACEYSNCISLLGSQKVFHCPKESSKQKYRYFLHSQQRILRNFDYRERFAEALHHEGCAETWVTECATLQKGPELQRVFVILTIKHHAYMETFLCVYNKNFLE